MWTYTEQSQTKLPKNAHPQCPPKFQTTTTNLLIACPPLLLALLFLPVLHSSLFFLSLLSSLSFFLWPSLSRLCVRLDFEPFSSLWSWVNSLNASTVRPRRRRRPGRLRSRRPRRLWELRLLSRERDWTGRRYSSWTRLHLLGSVKLLFKFFSSSFSSFLFLLPSLFFPTLSHQPNARVEQSFPSGFKLQYPQSKPTTGISSKPELGWTGSGRIGSHPFPILDKKLIPNNWM